MINQNLARGLYLLAISLVFGIWSTRYDIGSFSRAGPGLFPLMIACLLGLIGIATVVRARMMAPEAMHFNFKNVALVIGSLCGFALISEHVNMTAGIIFMVFCSTFAGTSYSVVRNIKLCVGLLAIAFAMAKGLGVNLPLF
ncbi:MULTISPECIES: tripartite tricarboxylate transporter TctB family protein [Ramlibacter]|uniref:Tripartite tricarboxylate transporter TctB family protein n=1 Tax=Ramlibacter aquaticus TaxID=2780094 RepID=A0ABR9SI85_9BURK|nr:MULTISPECIES: tripartite tricarboxylate transporter TctB family protein [Ramlibacter]MBE7942055.1 tripartite tricarboxylate transporter TctB family protein [Ramlibacter aquaticus]